MTAHNFNNKLQCSKGVLSESIEDTIKAMLPGCVDVDGASEDEDKNGIDYWAHLESGHSVAIDVKTRERGCKKFWQNGLPELALEVWSNVSRKTIGWTLDVSKKTEYVFYIFDQSDSNECFLIPFQLLRSAFKKNGRDWYNEFGSKIQKSTDANGNTWQSEAIFVPAPVVLSAVFDVMKYTTS